MKKKARLTRVAFPRHSGFRRNPLSHVGNGNDTNG